MHCGIVVKRVPALPPTTDVGRTYTRGWDWWPSSVLHTNGYSLPRAVFSNTPWDKYVEELGTTLGESQLVIHRSYLKSVDNL
jgi:hypothetical protein